MKIESNIVRLISASIAAIALLTLSSCNDKDSYSSSRGSKEVGFSASVAGGTASVVSKSESGAVTDDIVDEVIELRSADGSIVIPICVTVSDTDLLDGYPLQTKGSYINGPHSQNEPGSMLALSDSLDTFSISAYYTDTRAPFFNTNPLTSEWNESAGKWSVGHVYYWPQATGLDFYAWANMPAADNISVSIDPAAGTQTLAYVVPDNTDNQTDILMAVYSGTGSVSGDAELIFRHPLTSVQFKRGDPQTLAGVRKITMSGVHYSGTAVQSINSQDFSWTMGDDDETVVQDNDGQPFEVHGEIDGDPFLLIPQRQGETNQIELTVIVNINGHEVPLNSILDNVVWEEGKTYTYVIGYAGEIKSEMTMTSVSATEKANPVISNTGSRKIYVRATAAGYITDIAGNIKSTWLKDDGTNKGAFTVSSGTFGSASGWNTDWVAGIDGFWYYRKPLECTGNEAGMRTTPLFDTYSITGLGSGDLFELLISSQAIEWDSEKRFIKQAWGEAAAALVE